MKKKIFIFIILLLLITPFISVKAEKELDWSGYKCYFLTGDPSAGYYYPIFTTRPYNAINDTSDGEELPNPLCYGSKDMQRQRYPVIQDNSCEAQISYAKRKYNDIDADAVGAGGWHDNNCHDGGCQFYYYDDWTDPTGGNSKKPADCLAAAVITEQGLNVGTSSVDGSSVMAPFLLIEAKKNSDFYDENQMNKMKEIDSSFNDDTEFCFMRHNGGANGTTDKQAGRFFFSRVYVVANFSYIIQTDTKDVYILTDETDDWGRQKIRNLSGDYMNQYVSQYVSPNPYNTIDAENVYNITADQFNASPGNDSVIITKEGGKGLITTYDECEQVIKGWVKEVYGGTDEQVENISNSITTTDSSNITDFELMLKNGYTKSKAIDACSSGSTGSPKCYKYTFGPKLGTPMYNTTVWTDKQLGCGFTVTNWDYDTCRDGNLSNLYSESVQTASKTYNGNITHSGYNGVADFYVKTAKKKQEIQCSNLKAFHIIYRVGIIMAPILTIIFVTFDLVSSIISGDPKKVSKFREKLIRRLIALFLLLMIPILISILVNTLSKNSAITNIDKLKCIVNGK